MLPIVEKLILMLIRETHIVNQTDVGRRLEEFCYSKFTNLPTRKGTKKAIKRNQILVNGEFLPGSYFVQLNDSIVLVDVLNAVPFKVFPLEIDILYEDEYLAIVYKPSGFPVSGNYYKTIEHALPFNLEPTTVEDKLAYPLPCHRLDRSTSGCLIVAKTYFARVHIGEQFNNRSVRKSYHALIVGAGEIPSEVLAPINDKESHSSICVLRTIPSLSNDEVSLVNLVPHTGRTHQLRIHCAQVGFPILGDPLYGSPKARLKGKGLFLCATGLSFTHPITLERLEVSCSIPPKFDSFLDREENRYNNNVK